MKSFMAGLVVLGITVAGGIAPAAAIMLSDSEARVPVDFIGEQHPQSIFDEIRDSAPRALFDQLRDSAP